MKDVMWSRSSAAHGTTPWNMPLAQVGQYTTITLIGVSHLYILHTQSIYVPESTKASCEGLTTLNISVTSTPPKAMRWRGPCRLLTYTVALRMHSTTTHTNHENGSHLCFAAHTVHCKSVHSSMQIRITCADGRVFYQPATAVPLSESLKCRMHCVSSVVHMLTSAHAECEIRSSRLQCEHYCLKYWCVQWTKVWAHLYKKALSNTEVTASLDRFILLNMLCIRFNLHHAYTMQNKRVVKLS